MIYANIDKAVKAGAILDMASSDLVPGTICARLIYGDGVVCVMQIDTDVHTALHRLDEAIGKEQQPCV